MQQPSSHVLTGVHAVRQRGVLALVALLAGLILAVLAGSAAIPARAQGATDTVAQGAGGGAATARPVQPGSQVLAFNPELGVDNQGTSFRMRLNALIQPRAFVLSEPDRLVVEMPEVTFRMPARVGATGKGLIAGWRGGLFAPGRSRLVFDLSAPAQVVRLSVTPDPTTGVATFDLELAPTSRESFRAEAARAKAKIEALPVATAPVERGSAGKGDREMPAGAGSETVPVVVIDPGHGGVDFGTWSRFSEMQEKELVLAVGHLLRDRLVATKRFKVVMTRNTDVFVPLEERVRIARAAKADLFVSLHADAEETPGVHGATIYTLSESASDQRAADLAAKENRADTLAGLDVPEITDEVTDILIDLTRRETMQLSHLVARGMVDELKKSDRAIRTNPHRSAGFKVLKAHDIPSVLIELGFMTNREDVERMASAEGRKTIAETLQRTIEGYFARQMATAAAPVRAGTAQR